MALVPGLEREGSLEASQSGVPNLDELGWEKMGVNFSPLLTEIEHFLYYDLGNKPHPRGTSCDSATSRNDRNFQIISQLWSGY